MNKLLDLRETELVQLVLHEVLNRFDVMVGRAFNLLDLDCVVLGKRLKERAAKYWKESGGNAFQLRQRQLTKCDEILGFNSKSESDQRRFGKERPQFGRLFGIATIDWRNGPQSVLSHGVGTCKRRESTMNPSNLTVFHWIENCCRRRLWNSATITGR